jgi:hypothetical protein
MAVVDVELIDLIEQLHAEAHRDSAGRTWPRRLCTEQVCRDITREYIGDWPGANLGQKGRTRR